MKFIATKTGFFDGSLRQQGDEFEAPESFKAAWAVPAETPAGKAAEAKKPTEVKKPTPKALSELAAPGKTFNAVNAEKTDLA